MKLGKYKLFRNKPLTGANWQHGDKHDPRTWPFWRLFSWWVVRLGVQPPSRGWRLWIYTRTKAHYFDFVIDERCLICFQHFRKHECKARARLTKSQQGRD